ncbi:UNVERIFIED_ORG: glycosyltransferase involved in cell wall biosynthesis [Sphingomonas sp. R1F5B]
MTQIILDVSRLISRMHYSTPSGVDRVEMAYVRGLLARFGDGLDFAAVHPTGLYGRLRRDAILPYFDELERRWSREENSPERRSVISNLPLLFQLLPRRPRGRGRHAVYIQVSPHHLAKTAKIRRILAQENAQFACLVHDLIPMEFPEYARPDGAALHQRRIETVTGLADLVIVNSAATGRAMQPWIARSGRSIAMAVALLGTVPMVPAAPWTGDGRPYFVCLGTIEPRKNHLLLLHVWRHLAETLPADRVPKLVIIGRRGWENEQVVDLLERCPALKGHVEEWSGCPDRQLSAVLRGAKGLLMPSFAEGYGMPVAEALAVGTPALCSDIAALREVGGPVADYLDPLDGPAWTRAIVDFAEDGPMRQAQLRRVPGWHNPTWDEHLDTVVAALARLPG